MEIEKFGYCDRVLNEDPFEIHIQIVLPLLELKNDWSKCGNISDSISSILSVTRREDVNIPKKNTVFFASIANELIENAARFSLEGDSQCCQVKKKREMFDNRGA